MSEQTPEEGTTPDSTAPDSTTPDSTTPGSTVVPIPEGVSGNGGAPVAPATDTGAPTRVEVPPGTVVLREGVQGGGGSGQRGDLLVRRSMAEAGMVRIRALADTALSQQVQMGVATDILMMPTAALYAILNGEDDPADPFRGDTDGSV